MFVFEEAKLSYILLKNIFSNISRKVYSEPWKIENQKNFQNSGIFKTLVYLEPEAYSKPWYIQNSSIFRTRAIFRTLVYSEPETYSKHSQIYTMERFVKVATQRTFCPQVSKFQNFLALRFSCISVVALRAQK